VKPLSSFKEHGTGLVYVRVKFSPKGRPYHYSAPAGLVRPGDVVAVPCNWVSPEGTLADVVAVLGEPPEIPGVDTFAAIWRVIPPDQLPLFGREGYPMPHAYGPEASQ
jgi:hypothetical protein